MDETRKIRLRAFWPSGVALAAAVGIAVLAPHWVANSRLTNLDLTNDGILDTYLIFSRTTPGRCHILTRRQATMRRYDAKQRGKTRRYTRFTLGADTPAAWFVWSKDKASLFLVPVEEVSDWTYPFLYRLVRDRFPDLELPPVEWTQLFVNRTYQGLYLRMQLPFDLRHNAGGSGILREFLIVDGDHLGLVDTRFEDAGTVHAGLIADGQFPRLAEVPGPLAWLGQRCPTRVTTFLLSNQPPHHVSSLPLPLSLAALYEGAHGRALGLYVDERYQRWVRGARQDAPPTDSLFTAAERMEATIAFVQYVTDFRRALQGHAVRHDKTVAAVGILSQRQQAVIDLGWDVRGI